MRRQHLTFPDERGGENGCEIFVWSIDSGSKSSDTGVAAIADPSLVGRVLTRRVLAEMLHIKSHQVVLTKDAHGRPALDAARMSTFPAAKRLDFSCAHSENLFAVGVAADGRIGIDLEVLRPENVLPLLTCRELAPAERAWISALPESERPLAFYHCWTAKEALLKALGLGIAFGMEQIEIVRDATGRHSLAKISNSRQLAEGWSLEHRVLQVEHVSAMVAVVWGVG